MNLHESKGSRSPLHASGGLWSVKELTDSFGSDGIRLSLYVQKINTPRGVGASVGVRSPEWCSEFLTRSTKPPAKIRVGPLVKAGGLVLRVRNSLHHSGDRT